MSGDRRRTGSRPRPIPRPSPPPGPVRDLKDAIYELYTAAGQPSVLSIARDIADEESLDLPGYPKKDTVNRIIGGDRVLGEHDVVSVAMLLAHRAKQDVAEVEDRVRQLWAAAKRAPVPAAAAATGPGRAIGDYDALALEVHPAITVAGAEGLAPLPTYVPRGHDALLAEVVADAAAGNSRIAVLVGSSSSGKSRACWEAVQVLGGSWRLWHPYGAASVAATIPEVVPNTVIWLNDTRQFLMTRDPALGEDIAAALRGLLGDPARGPVLVLGTMWAEYWTPLTAHPAGPADPDHHAQARELVAGTSIPVADEFAGDDLEAVRAAGRRDPRLLEAVSKADHGRVTQYLAGVPMLVERYRTATAPARAVINVAMDARRLGHPPALPIELLRSAARDYLHPVERPGPGDPWMDRVLAELSSPRYGVQGPLMIIEDADDVAGPACRLADYLEALGRRERADFVPPASFWRAGFSREEQAKAAAPTALQVEGFREFFRQHYRELVRYGRMLGATHDDAGAAVGAALTRMADRWPTVGDALAEARRDTVGQLAEIRRAAHAVSVPETSAWHDEDQVRLILSTITGPIREIVESLVGENGRDDITVLLGATVDSVLVRVAEIGAEFEPPRREEG